MQLILVLVALMLLGGGKGSPRDRLSGSDMLEVLKYVSGDDCEMDKIIKEVEQVTQIINTLAPIASAFGGQSAAEEKDASELSSQSTGDAKNIGLILQPISNIADDSIYSALSNAIA